jgi:hypothetical protein
MQSRARVRGKADAQTDSQPFIAGARNRDAELAAIALLCLVFASPIDESQEPQLRLIWA